MSPNFELAAFAAKHGVQKVFNGEGGDPLLDLAAFTAVANADPAEKATLLSQSISIAMNTTAFGLMVAIPLLLVHSMLQSKTAAIVESLEIAVVKFLNAMEQTAPTPAANSQG